MRLRVCETKWANYFPQERPLNGRRLKVWAEHGRFLGEGLGTERRKTGNGIFAAGKHFDSNYILHWIYDDEPEMHERQR